MIEHKLRRKLTLTRFTAMYTSYIYLGSLVNAKSNRLCFGEVQGAKVSTVIDIGKLPMKILKASLMKKVLFD
jgi:hypothetical protein